VGPAGDRLVVEVVDPFTRPSSVFFPSQPSQSEGAPAPEWAGGLGRGHERERGLEGRAVRSKGHAHRCYRIGSGHRWRRLEKPGTCQM